MAQTRDADSGFAEQTRCQGINKANEDQNWHRRDIQGWPDDSAGRSQRGCQGASSRDGLQRRIYRGVLVGFCLPTHNLVTLQLIFYVGDSKMKVDSDASEKSTLKEEAKPDDVVKEKQLVSGGNST